MLKEAYERQLKLKTEEIAELQAKLQHVEVGKD